MQGFLDTLIRPDREEDPERTLVARAANILQVGEFQLLQLAYRQWYGRDLPTALIDRLFSAYMLHNEVPSWARHYARRIIDLYESNLIDPNDPHYHRYDHEYVTHVPQGVRQFCVACMILVALIVGSIWIGHLSVGEATSILPPYFERSHLEK